MRSIAKGDFVACNTDKGHVVEAGGVSPFETHFSLYSIAHVRDLGEGWAHVYVIGEKAVFVISSNDIAYIDPTKTGKGFQKKICNICHVIKLHSEFDVNQTDAKGRATSRPSCKICRRDIDKKPIGAAAKRKAEKDRPKDGTLWSCPICRKQSIVGVTAKVVLDHRHSDGASRTFLCDSCNTGLGRFKNGENYLQNALSYVKNYEKTKGGPPKQNHQDRKKKWKRKSCHEMAGLWI